MRLLKLLLVVFVCGVAAPAVAGPFEDGVAAHDNGDYATALRLWRPLAEQGYANAETNLGIMYYEGRGVPQDYAAAMSWYRKAAEQGYANAQTNLGAMYNMGRGVPQDFAAAVMWYRKAADQGEAVAQYNLANMYDKGRSVPQDYGGSGVVVSQGSRAGLCQRPDQTQQHVLPRPRRAEGLCGGGGVAS